MFSGVTCIRFDYIVLGVINKDEKLAVWKVPEQENTHMIQDSQIPTNKWVLPRGKSSQAKVYHIRIHHGSTTSTPLTTTTTKSLFGFFFFFSFFSGSQIASSTGGGSGEASIYDFSFP